jgi:hypothetical protein
LKQKIEYRLRYSARELVAKATPSFQQAAHHFFIGSTANENAR